ncbi:MAG TPA: MlaD family protein [Streptosporangiaceae bacterium]|nr:MlaD family protein [Streptosporangiaceae bacterium]
MLTRATRVRLAVFAVVGILVIAYTGIHYADLGRFLGLRGYYVVRLDLANGGGIYCDADVTYRGVPVGRVGAMRLTGNGIEVDLDISDSAPLIPARLDAGVADLSAVGEQYVDLRPQAPAGPYLHSDSVIPERDTELPIPVTSLLNSVNTLATSLPLSSLRELTDELAAGFGGQGGNVANIVAGNAALIHAANATLRQTTTLIRDSQEVIDTQVAESSELDSFSQNLLLLARQLDKSNASIRKLVIAGPQAAAQIADLLAETNPGLGDLIANLLTTSEVTLTRGADLDELLSALPAAVSVGSTAVTSKGATFGLALTFFNPLPCTAGYGGTTFLNGLNTSPDAPLNTGAYCAKPASSGVDVRGSANAPGGGGVPPAAEPGMAQLLGVAP